MLPKLMGAPLWKVYTPLSCQPPSNGPRPKGSSHSAWFIHWWRGTE